jgi:hypothetical protein
VGYSSDSNDMSIEAKKYMVESCYQATTSENTAGWRRLSVY